jgi:hypothetical protein
MLLVTEVLFCPGHLYPAMMSAKREIDPTQGSQIFPRPCQLTMTILSNEMGNLRGADKTDATGLVSIIPRFKSETISIDDLSRNLCNET